MAQRIIRRVFLRRLGQVAGAGLLLPAAACRKPEEAPASAAAKASRSPTPPVETALSRAPTLPAWATGLSTLSAEQALCAEAMLERLLPSNVPAGSPGARETRTLLHLDRVLATKAYAGYARLVRDGLGRLDGEATKKHGQVFARLSPDLQDALLAEWQTRPSAPRAYPTARFFSLVFTFAIEGFLGDPKHGANFEKVAWKWIDFTPGCPTPSGHCGPGHAP